MFYRGPHQVISGPIADIREGEIAELKDYLLPENISAKYDLLVQAFVDGKTSVFTYSYIS